MSSSEPSDDSVDRLMRSMELVAKLERGLTKIFGVPVVCVAGYNDEDFDTLHDISRRANRLPPKDRRRHPVRVLRPGYDEQEVL
jgi:hypothetical protein